MCCSLESLTWCQHSKGGLSQLIVSQENVDLYPRKVIGSIKGKRGISIWVSPVSEVVAKLGLVERTSVPLTTG